MKPLRNVYNLYPCLYVCLLDLDYKVSNLKELKRGQIMRNFIIIGKAKNVFRVIKLMAQAEKTQKKAQRKASLN